MNFDWIRAKEYDGSTAQEIALNDYDRYITLANACQAAFDAAKWILTSIDTEHMLAKAKCTSFDGISDYFFLWHQKYPYTEDDMKYNAEDAYSYAYEWGAELTINIDHFSPRSFPIQITFASRKKQEVLVFGIEYIPYNELKYIKIPEWFKLRMKEISDANK